MPVRPCSGFVNGVGKNERCCFHPSKAGQRAQGKFDGKCAWCSPARLRTVVKDDRLQRLHAHYLANMHKLDKKSCEKMVLLVSKQDGGNRMIDRAEAIMDERERKTWTGPYHVRENNRLIDRADHDMIDDKAIIKKEARQ